MTAIAWVGRRAAPMAPVALAVLVGFVASGLIATAVGLNPFLVFSELIRGAVEGPELSETIARAVPLVGMALSAALPLRGGMINLGGDGQVVLGGCLAAIVALYLPAPEGVRTATALIAGAMIGGGWAMLAVAGEVVARIPMLVSSWLLSYPAKAICGYLVLFPLRDPANVWPSTHKIATGVRLARLVPDTPINIGLAVIAILAILIVAFDRRTSAGFELRLRGVNDRFVRYGGVDMNRQALAVMFASGALAGLVGAIMVLGAQYRFTDGALTAPQYSWSGTLAALLADGEPVGAIVASIFFAALQTGGFAMERSVEIPRVLTMVLESVIILFLSMRGVTRRRIK
jgi:simple sugar transport system permease protein